MALELEMHPTEISRLESGRRNPTLATLQRVAGGFGIRCSEMIALAGDLDVWVKRL